MKALFFAKDGSGKTEEKDIPGDMKDQARTLPQKDGRADRGDRRQPARKISRQGRPSAGGAHRRAEARHDRRRTAAGAVRLAGQEHGHPAAPGHGRHVPSVPGRAGRDRADQGKGPEDRQRDNVCKPTPDEHLAALVFKTINDPFAGKLSLVRVFSGTLKADSRVYNSTRQVKEKIGTLFHVQGKKQVAGAGA